MPAPLPARTTPTPLEAAGLSDPGRQREENEDALGLFPHERLFIVADGMGGRVGGRVAADVAVLEIERFYREKQRDPRSPWPFEIDKQTSFGANLLRVGIKVANQKVREAAQADPNLSRMAATVAVLAVGETQIVIGHLGDVRLYRLRGGTLERLTRDHSVLEEMLAVRPDMTPEEIARFGHRNIVTKALGTKEEVEPTVTTYDLAAGDLFLLCCDGLWDPVDAQTIADVLNGTPDLQQACATLIEAANAAGGPDNVTVVLARVS